MKIKQKWCFANKIYANTQYKMADTLLLQSRKGKYPIAEKKLSVAPYNI